MSFEIDQNDETRLQLQQRLLEFRDETQKRWKKSKINEELMPKREFSTIAASKL